MYKARASRRPRQSAALASPACSWPPPPRAPGRQALGRALVCWPWAEPTVFALRFQFSFSVFALNAESSCLLSKLLCLLPSFVLDIVSAGVMETHVFRCNDFWGFCWWGGGKGRPVSAPETGPMQAATPGAAQNSWQALGVC